MWTRTLVTIASCMLALVLILAAGLWIGHNRLHLPHFRLADHRPHHERAFSYWPFAICQLRVGYGAFNDSSHCADRAF